ncbi:AraC family transcriptional regulator [Bremerella sp. P1]|uniref:AraC family transcriptional regulator n=1 Tax=Bremerella sp. P1 TaxID=3026424 RepID=UPI0023680851|nr:AraC family transcriptional regulator [Bremerella sp. P1]WDI39907.1 AraC family transcriptional regulator [Bremerella sp. P1]
MNSPEMKTLVSAIARHAKADALIPTEIPELKLSSFASPTQNTSLVYEPCLCIVAQGAKEVVLAGDSYRMDPGQFLLVSVDLPVDARVLEATANNPYVGLQISFDPKVVGELLADGTAVSSTGPPERGLAVSNVEPKLLDAVTRLVHLLDEPQDIGPLAPYVLREITHRVLTSSQGLRLRQMALAGAPAYRIAQAIRWLKAHFADPLKIESLAEQVGLSTSSFHLHFKNVTAMTPLQYQKRMRLQEARNLMLGEKIDAAQAAFRVGYESPSQFSREYRRMFGAPPRQDIDAVLAATS